MVSARAKFGSARQRTRSLVSRYGFRQESKYSARKRRVISQRGLRLNPIYRPEQRDASGWTALQEKLSDRCRAWWSYVRPHCSSSDRRCPYLTADLV